MLGRRVCSVLAAVVALGCGKDPGGPPANGSEPPGYNVTLRFVASPTPSQSAAVQDAAYLWQQIITGDLPALAITSTSGACGGVPAQNETVDDILIWVRIEAIDGAGGILGQAGPCVVRGGGGLPAVGVMILDEADMGHSFMRRVIVHEMAHALGFGTRWTSAGLLTDQGGTDPIFTGAQAISQFNSVGGSTYSGRKVPLENTGSSGTRDSHWRETVFGTELMTGFLNTPSDPLSAVSVGSMADLGYTVNMGAAELYLLPPLSAALRAEPPLALGDDVLRLPVKVLDQQGRVVRP